jgi:hypothetical protein
MNLLEFYNKYSVSSCVVRRTLKTSKILIEDVHYKRVKTLHQEKFDIIDEQAVLNQIRFKNFNANKRWKNKIGGLI